MRNSREWSSMSEGVRQINLPPYFTRGSHNDSCLGNALANGINQLAHSLRVDSDEVFESMGLQGRRSKALVAFKTYVASLGLRAKADIVPFALAVQRVDLNHPAIVFVNKDHWFHEVGYRPIRSALGAKVRSLLPADHAILVYDVEDHARPVRYRVFDTNFRNGVVIPQDMLNRVASRAQRPISMEVQHGGRN